MPVYFYIYINICFINPLNFKSMKNNYNLIKTLALFLFLSSLRAGAQCSTPTTVPYYEGFNGITLNNELPLCWAASNMSNTCLTYTAGASNGNYAAFSNATAGVNYFYSRSIQLNAGVTYSAGVWYNNTVASSANWTDLSLLIGTTQSPAGLTGIASTNGPANSSVYTLLANTFTVAVTGTYYIAVRGTSIAGALQYLNFDDLSVTAPCSANTPSLSVAGPSVTCSGSAVTFTASGASTYTWGGGSVHTATYLVLPNVPINAIAFFSVTGTSALTGCMGVASKSISIKTTPQVTVTSNKPNNEVCSGRSITLMATSSNPPVAYSWAPAGPVTASATFTPNVNTVYTVSATNIPNNCTGTQTIAVTTKASPTINAVSSQPTICAGESAVLTASGADTYSWIVNGTSGTPMTGENITVSPTVQTTYFIAGTNTLTGCIDDLLFIQGVAACQGLNAYSNTGGLNLYPNPNNGAFTIEGSTAETTIGIFDITGKKVYTAFYGSEGKVTIHLNNLSSSFYYVKVSAYEKTTVIKMLKQ